MRPFRKGQGKSTGIQLKSDVKLKSYAISLILVGYKRLRNAFTEPSCLLGFRIKRELLYRDRVYGDLARPVPEKIQWEPEPWTKDDDNNLQQIYELFADKDFRDTYDIKKPSKKIIKEVVKTLHEEGLASSEAIDQIGRVVDMIIELNPDLEKEALSPYH